LGVDFGLFKINFSQFLVAEFIVMAAVLIARPYGLLAGRTERCARSREKAGGADRPATPLVKEAWRAWRLRS